LRMDYHAFILPDAEACCSLKDSPGKSRPAMGCNLHRHHRIGLQ
jgi:hypothetical protein